jgi:hypothetical protein
LEPSLETQKALRQYLLGELPPDAQQQLEEQLLADDVLYEELLVCEDELLDQYLAGTLPAEARGRVESHFLVTPARQQKLVFASAFKRYVAQTGAAAAATPSDEPAADLSAATRAAGHAPRSSPPRFLFQFRRPVLSWALAAMLLLMISTVTWLAIKRPRPHIRTQVLAVTLTPGAVRGGDGGLQRLKPPAPDTLVQLQLELPSAEYQSYTATLQTDDGRSVLTQNALKAETMAGAHYVRFDVPAERLARGDYRVRLSGVARDTNAPEDVASYSFRVVP